MIADFRGEWLSCFVGLSEGFLTGLCRILRFSCGSFDGRGEKTWAECIIESRKARWGGPGVGHEKEINIYNKRTYELVWHIRFSAVALGDR